MNVKNIKSFVEFYESLGISTFISKSQRTSNNRLNSILPKKDNQVIVNDNSIEEKIDRLNILKNKVENNEFLKKAPPIVIEKFTKKMKQKLALKNKILTQIKS